MHSHSLLEESLKCCFLHTLSECLIRVHRLGSTARFSQWGVLFLPPLCKVPPALRGEPNPERFPLLVEGI